MYVYDCIALLYSRNWHNIVNQLHFNKKKKNLNVLISATQSKVIIYACVCVYIYTNTYVYTFFFKIFFSMVVYHGIVNVVPRAVQ